MHLIINGPAIETEYIKPGKVQRAGISANSIKIEFTDDSHSIIAIAICLKLYCYLCSLDLSPPKLRNQMLSQCFLKLRFVILQGESVSENNQCLGDDLELRGHEDLSALLLHPGLRPQVLIRSRATKCLQVSQRKPVL